jgi:hypothetical protein
MMKNPPPVRAGGCVFQADLIIRATAFCAAK